MANVIMRSEGKQTMLARLSKGYKNISGFHYGVVLGAEGYYIFVLKISEKQGPALEGSLKSK